MRSRAKVSAETETERESPAPLDPQVVVARRRAEAGELCTCGRMAVVVFLIVKAFLPASPEKMFDRAADLMKSDNPDDWEKGLHEYLEQIQNRLAEIDRALHATYCANNELATITTD